MVVINTFEADKDGLVTEHQNEYDIRIDWQFFTELQSHDAIVGAAVIVGTRALKLKRYCSEWSRRNYNRNGYEVYPPHSVPYLVRDDTMLYVKLDDKTLTDEIAYLQKLIAQIEALKQEAALTERTDTVD